ncbi:phage protein Gp36 family protein [Chryseobacterium mulctrae]|uniref:phage protein Gp36 family protein n=1 Tax=Chryseobacterium mulctrae TaxID=2576777 RepID=UPI0011174AD1|nr:phage protein Gp36 family protein [Chryseobacterium mulctrae]
MAFITDNDYSLLVRREIKDVLLEDYFDEESEEENNERNTKLSTAEQTAISQVKNYLFGKYDTNKIFSATGDARNSHIVMITMDCALYHLYTGANRKAMPEVRSQRYGDAIEWLKLVATGEGTADLPPKTNDSGESITGIKFSSRFTSESQRW